LAHAVGVGRAADGELGGAGGDIGNGVLDLAACRLVGGVGLGRSRGTAGGDRGVDL